MKGLSICLIAEGVIWTLAVVLIYLALSGMSDPVSFPVTFLYFAALPAGPVLLLIEPALVLTGSYARTGVVMTVIACAILSGTVAYTVSGIFHVQPLQVTAISVSRR